MSAACPGSGHTVRDVTDLIVRELRLRPFSDAATAPAHPRERGAAAVTPDARLDAEPLSRLSARHSLRRVVDEHEL
jgi:hypothetical protein